MTRKAIEQLHKIIVKLEVWQNGSGRDADDAGLACDAKQKLMRLLRNIEEIHDANLAEEGRQQ